MGLSFGILIGLALWRGDKLPKAKPTQVIVHRIELQEREREMLEPFVKAKEVEQYGKTVAAVGAAGALGVGAWIAWWTCDTLYGWMGTAKDKATEIRQRIKDAEEQTGTNYGDMMKSSSPAARIFLTLIGV